MKIKVLNNRKKKRAFSNGFWYKQGIMFPWKKRKYLQIGMSGYIFLIQWGSFN